MKKSNIINRLFILAVPLTLLLANIGSARCESQPAGLNNAQSLVTRNDTKMEKSSDQEMQDDKSQRFKEIEWLIRQNLMKEYEKLAVNEDLEDHLD